MSVAASASSGPTRHHVLKLYRRLLKQGSLFKDYNFRETACRKIREGFREHQSVDDLTVLSAVYRRGEDSLRVLQRQAVVQNLYHHQPYVIEQQLQLRPRTPAAFPFSPSLSTSAPSSSSLPGSMEDDPASLHQQLTSFTSRGGQNAMDMIDGSSDGSQASQQPQRSQPTSQQPQQPHPVRAAAAAAPRSIPSG